MQTKHSNGTSTKKELSRCPLANPWRARLTMPGQAAVGCGGGDGTRKKHTTRSKPWQHAVRTYDSCLETLARHSLNMWFFLKSLRKTVHTQDKFLETVARRCLNARFFSRKPCTTWCKLTRNKCKTRSTTWFFVKNLAKHNLIARFLLRNFCKRLFKRSILS